MCKIEEGGIVVHKFKYYQKYEIIEVMKTGQSVCKRLSDNKKLILDNEYLLSVEEARIQKIDDILKQNS
jgi:hypothetical protein